MTKVNVSDFYYGSVLSLLLNNHFKPALVEGGKDRQVYDITTNSGQFRLFMKYRANKEPRVSTNSWLFTITESDKNEIIKYINEGHNLVVALVCGVEGFIDSQIAFIKSDEIFDLIVERKKNSLTISRKTRERAFRISRGGGRENALTIKANRFEELFHLPSQKAR